MLLFAVLLHIIRIAAAVVVPIIGMTDAPGPLRPGQVVEVVRIVPALVLFPLALAGTLARRGGAIGLAGCVGFGLELLFASNAAFAFHRHSPCRLHERTTVLPDAQRGAAGATLHQRDVLTTILQRGNETIIPYNCLSVIKYLNVEMADSGRHAAQNNDVEMRKLLTESGAKLKEAL